MTQVPKHKQKGIFPYSTRFVQNAAKFSAEEGQALGGFYQLSLPLMRLFVVTDPDLIKQISVTEESKFEKSRIYWKQLLATVGPALGSLEGDEWLFLRRLHMPYLTNSAVDRYLPSIYDISRHYFDELNSKKQIGDLAEFFAVLNTKVLLKILFGASKDKQVVEITERIADGEEFLSWKSEYPWRPWLSKYNGRAKIADNHLEFFNQFVSNVVEEHTQNQSDIKVLLDCLLDEYAKNGKLSAEDLEQIRNEFIIYLGAGTETLSISETWTLILLDRHPEILKRVRKEIDSVAEGRPLTIQQCQDLVELKSVILESMRLYPPSYGIVRDCIEPTNVGGMDLKKGDTMFISVIGAHRRDELWEDANEFKPERFHGVKDVAKNAYTYFPYGVGKHHCIGRYIATPQMMITLANFLQRFDYKVLNQEYIDYIALSTLKPDAVVKISIAPR